MREKNKNKKFIPKPPQKPNFQLWLIITAVIVLIGVTWFNQNSAVIEITNKRFEDMVLSNDVGKVVVIYNQNYVEVTLKEEALQNQRYKDELGAQNRFYNVTGPHYKINVASVDSFIERYNELEQKLPEDERIGYSAKKEESWGNWISSFGFLILIFFLFWMMMRRMSGPSGPGVQIFNVGKSRAQLFDAENK